MITNIYGTILCIGDSLTYGARSETTIGYPEYLGFLLQTNSRYPISWGVLNAGKCGETTSELIKRFPKEITWLSNQAGAKWCIIWTGTNDAKNLLCSELYGKLLHSLISWPRRLGIGIAIITLPLIDSDNMPCFPREVGEWRKEANKVIRELVKDGVVVIDVDDLSMDCLADGVHLNDKGYRIVAERAARTMGLAE